MKKQNFLIFFCIVIVSGFIFIIPGSIKTKERSYFPQLQNRRLDYSAFGAIEYLAKLRTNQITHTINVNDVINAQKQVKRLSSNKSTSSNWVNRGPDNVGGRTRAIIFDNENANIMFAGGVSGGLWKSTSKGQYWEQVEYSGANTTDFSNLAVTTIAQSSNGDIYFGTGEALYLQNNHGSNTQTPMLMGGGIWKSSNRGKTFVRLSSTWGDGNETFIYTNKIGIDKNKGTIYAATGKGLKVSDDGGTSWNNAKLEINGYDRSFSSEVKVAADGSVITSIDNLCFVKKADKDTFLLRSGADESETVFIDGNTVPGHLISMKNIGRLEFDYSPQDPLTVFCAASDQINYNIGTLGKLRHIYQSTDGGENWVIIGKGETAIFQPFGVQGVYDMCITVNPLNKNEVFIGGFDIWVGRATNNSSLFAWSQASVNAVDNLSTLYVHADQHIIVFDPSNPKSFFIGTDGGLSLCRIDEDGQQYQFRTMNKNYNVTQFYSVAFNGKGAVLGGSQDNGSLLIGYEDIDEKSAIQVLGGDGGHSIMSSINSNIGFATTQFGGLWRNNDEFFNNWSNFYVTKINNMHWASSPLKTYDPSLQEGSFVTPIAYYETDNDEHSIDTLMFIVKRDYVKGEKLNLYSHNIYKAPIKKILEKDYFEGDTIFYKDNYGSLFAFGMSRTIWLTRNATNWDDIITDRDWWRSVNRGVFSTSNREYVTQMAFSANGNNLFFSTSESKVYRLSNLDSARTYHNACYIDAPFSVITELTQIAGFNNRSITGIACDPNSVKNVIITLGNYGNYDYVYLCNNADSVLESSYTNNFVNITGNIPRTPAYCSLIEKTDGAGRVMVGTEMGVFITEDIFNSNPEDVIWTNYSNNVGVLPIFQIKQQTINWKFAQNTGKIYIGTHGGGIFENGDFYTSINENSSEDNIGRDELIAHIFPNPVIDKLNIRFNYESKGSTMIKIISLNGMVVHSFSLNDNYLKSNFITLDMNSLKQGIYLLYIKIGNSETTKRIVKQ